MVNLFFLLPKHNEKKRLTIGNLFTIMFRTSITLTYELITLNVGEDEVLY